MPAEAVQTIQDDDQDQQVDSSVTEPNVSGDSEAAKRGQTRTKIRELLDLQDVCYRIITGAVRQVEDDGEVTDVPARELASLLTAWVKADQQVMVRRGQPVPKPAEVQPKGKRHGQSEVIHELPKVPKAG